MSSDIFTSVVLLDTSVQIDRRKMKNRGRHVEQLLAGYAFSISTSICLLEFKATIIQECITIHNNLRAKKRFALVRDSMCEKNHRQAKLRAHIFNNIVDVYRSSFDNTSPEDDERLAEKARLKLEHDIPELYKWFVEDSVDSILKRIDCTRANEPPRKKHVSFGTNLETCKRGVNKTCRVEELIRETAAPLLSQLEDVAIDCEQLSKAAGIFRRVLQDQQADLSHADCRRAGDCLIALEAMGSATHALSTNATEWGRLATICGFEFVRVQYPDEETR